MVMKCKAKSSETYVATEEESCLKEEKSESVVVVSSPSFFPETKLQSKKEFEMGNNYSSISYSFSIIACDLFSIVPWVWCRVASIRNRMHPKSVQKENE